MPPKRTRFRAARTLAPRYDYAPVIGLPPAAFPITNSQRKAAHCPRRWWWSYGLGLDTGSTGPMRFGSAFDNVMGRLLEWYRQTSSPASAEHLLQCPYCGGAGCSDCEGTGHGFVALECHNIRSAEAEDDGIDYDDLIVRLERAVHGWLKVYEESFLRDYTVVEVQPMIASPVISPDTGDVYRSKVPVVQTGDGEWRLANGYDGASDVSLVVMPFYQICKLDAIVINNNDGKLWVWETKTSGSPEQFSRHLMLDTQLPGYSRALWYLSKCEGQYGGLDVGGFVWDVTSSKKHEEPKVLKSGALSTAKNQRVPSWTWQAAMSTMSEEDSQKYAHMVEHAMESVDSRLYLRQWGEFTPKHLAAYEIELYADAVRISKWMRNLPGSGLNLWLDDPQVQKIWPRVPLCRGPGGFCSFTGPCLEDSFVARGSFNKRQQVRWLNKKALEALTKEAE